MNPRHHVAAHQHAHTSEHWLRITLLLSLLSHLIIAAPRPTSAAMQPAGSSTTLLSPVPVAQADSVAPARSAIADQYAQLPLRFEQNTGQSDSAVHFLARGAGYNLFLTSEAATLVLKPRPESFTDKPRRSGAQDDLPAATSSIRIALANAAAHPIISGLDPLPGTTNYLIGSDPAQWRTNVVSYSKVRYHNVYPGIDLVYYGNQHHLEYDLIVAPGHDPNQIALDIQGAQRIDIAPNGELLIRTAHGTVRQHAPVIYQASADQRRPIAGRYIKQPSGRISFSIAAYDRSQPLIIDPVITYATFLGSTNLDYVTSIDTDDLGALYLTGYTESPNYPITTSSAIQTNLLGGSEAFITKLSADGKTLLYSTFFGGTGDDRSNAIAVEPSGEVTIVGSTNSISIPLSVEHLAYQPVNNGGFDAFLAKLDPSGSMLTYSTFYGGSADDTALGVSINPNANNRIYWTGETSSSDFPSTLDSYRGGSDIFVLRTNPFLSGPGTLFFARLYGGTGNERANGIIVDNAGDATVAGATTSTNLPNTANGYQPNHSSPANQNDAFVTKFNFAGTVLNATYFGDSGEDIATAIGIDSSNKLFIAGSSDSASLPTLGPGAQTTLGGFTDAFVSKFDLAVNGAGSLLYSTYIGGSNPDAATALTINSANEPVVTGSTNSANFPTTGDALQASLQRFDDAFITRLGAMIPSRLFSTYFGGYEFTGTPSEQATSITTDLAGNLYVAGVTRAAFFPIVLPLQHEAEGAGDSFIVKIAGPVSSPNLVNTIPNQAIVGSPAISLTVNGDRFTEGIPQLLFTEAFSDSAGLITISNESAQGWSTSSICDFDSTHAHSVPGIIRWGNPSDCNSYTTIPNQIDSFVTPAIPLPIDLTRIQLLLRYRLGFDPNDTSSAVAVDISNNNFATSCATPSANCLRVTAHNLSAPRALINDNDWHTLRADFPGLLGGSPVRIRVSTGRSSGGDNVGVGIMMDDLEVVGRKAGSIIRWNGTNLPTTFINNRQLRVQIPSPFLSSPGVVQIDVVSPNAAPSNPQPFNINGLTPTHTATPPPFTPTATSSATLLPSFTPTSTSATTTRTATATSASATPTSITVTATRTPTTSTATRTPTAGSPTITVTPTPNNCTPAWGVAPTAIVPSQGRLNALSAAPTTLWAVGVRPEQGHDVMLIERWNGSAWTIESVPINRSYYSGLSGVAALTDSEAWAVGYQRLYGQEARTLILHRTTGGWSVFPSPNPNTGNNYLTAIKVVTANDIWAVGYSVNGGNSQALALRWNGSTWTAQTLPAISGNSQLFGVTVDTNGQTWAVGLQRATGSSPNQALILRWTGTAWVITPSASASGDHVLSSITTTSAGEVWAVGHRRPAGATFAESFAQRWTGSAWVIETLPTTSGKHTILTSIAASPTELWAVGYTQLNGITAPITIRWSGATRTIIPSPNLAIGSSRLQAVRISNGLVWAVGSMTVNGTSKGLHAGYGRCPGPGRGTK